MLTANDSFAGEFGGVPFVVRKGQTIDGDHPIAKKYAANFSEPTPSFTWHGPSEDLAVEEATVNPGEVRHVVPAPDQGVELVDDSYTLPQLRQIATSETGKGFGDKDTLIKRINDKRLKEA